MAFSNSGKRKALWGKIILIGMVAAALFMIGSVIVRSTNDPNRVKNAAQRSAYLASFGWEVDPAEETERLVRLPEEFPEVLCKYNDLQKKQGFDLTRFAGKEIRLYSYTVKNYSGAEAVEACLYVYKNHVIGGDIHSVGFTGFMCAIKSENASGG